MSSYVRWICRFGAERGCRVRVCRTAALRSGNAPAPTAASSAAPYAPPSSRFTVVTGRPNTSACNWRMNSLLAPPPVKSRYVGARSSSLRISRESKREAHALERSEEHTSELQSLAYLVCRLLLEKKKKEDKVR